MKFLVAILILLALFGIAGRIDYESEIAMAQVNEDLRK